MSSTKIAMAQPHSFQSGAFSFMSCTSGREGSPLDETTSHQPSDFKTETKKKRFHPLRNLRRMFRRKSRRSSISADSYQPGVPDNPEITSTNLEQRSCSTSRLQEENLTQNLIRNSRLNPGLSLSHDSIFTPDRADSGLSSSDLENSSLSITTVLTTPSKGFPIKSQSSCSETSLLSIGSSETELSPTRSGKLSDLDLGVTAYKLSHSAAKHKMAVKPKRNHGLPRNRRRPMVSTSHLPITPETGEEVVTDKTSSQLTSDLVISPVPPKPDKCPTETKISWSQLSADSSTKEPEGKFDKAEYESDSRREELSSQKTESFFGRFLSRRSDKKKKQLPGTNVEEREEEKHHYVKKTSKPLEGKGRVAKSPNRRQRVEPVEIPYSLNPSNEEDPFRKKPQSPVFSSSKSYWSSSMTACSLSPSKVSWPENSSNFKLAERDTEVPEKPKTDYSESTENAKKDLKNSDFVKELTECISSFSKEVAGKRKVDEEDGQALLKVRRQLSEEVSTADKLQSSETVTASKNKSVSSESEEVSIKSSDGHTPEDKANSKTNAPDFDLPTFSGFFEAIHDGYENIQIIELVKQEVKNLEPQQSDADKKFDGSIKEENSIEIEFAGKEMSNEKDSETVARRVKPWVSEKPKDIKGVGGQDLLKLNPARVPPSVEDSEKVNPKAGSTLVERRKSELLHLIDTDEKEGKTKIKPLKKQTSFSETTKDKGNAEDAKKISPFVEKTETTIEIFDEVVLRKKSRSVSDEQPELMKVFARRSLKVRESEKLAGEVQKSRDSDKENEVMESPREDRKKNALKDEKKEGETEENRIPVKENARTDEVMISVPLVKPETSASRKNFIPRYGRSLSENNAKSIEESTILEENKLNNLRSIIETSKSEGEEEETGFKRIQQRKAEWERRAQQGAK